MTLTPGADWIGSPRRRPGPEIPSSRTASGRNTRFYRTSFDFAALLPSGGMLYARKEKRGEIACF